MSILQFLELIGGWNPNVGCWWGSSSCCFPWVELMQFL